MEQLFAVPKNVQVKKMDRSFEEWQYVEEQYILQNVNVQGINNKTNNRKLYVFC